MPFVARDSARLRRRFLTAGEQRVTSADIAPGAVVADALAPGAAATAAQGELAESALQDAGAFATAAQGALAAAAYAWGDHAAAGYQPGLSYGVYEQQAANGDPGGTLTAGAWTLRALTYEAHALAGATLAAGALTLPAGTFLLIGEAPAYKVGAHRVAVFVDGAVHTHGVNSRAPAALDVVTSSGVTAVVTGPCTVDLRHWVATSTGTSDGGAAVTSGNLERYARLLIVTVE